MVCYGQGLWCRYGNLKEVNRLCCDLGKCCDNNLKKCNLSEIVWFTISTIYFYKSGKKRK